MKLREEAWPCTATNRTPQICCVFALELSVGVARQGTRYCCQVFHVIWPWVGCSSVSEAVVCYVRVKAPLLCTSSLLSPFPVSVSHCCSRCAVVAPCHLFTFLWWWDMPSLFLLPYVTWYLHVFCCCRCRLWQTYLAETWASDPLSSASVHPGYAVLGVEPGLRAARQVLCCTTSLPQCFKQTNKQISEMPFS